MLFLAARARALTSSAAVLPLTVVARRRIDPVAPATAHEVPTLRDDDCLVELLFTALSTGCLGLCVSCRVQAALLAALAGRCVGGAVARLDAGEGVCLAEVVVARGAAPLGARYACLTAYAGDTEVGVALAAVAAVPGARPGPPLFENSDGAWALCVDTPAVAAALAAPAARAAVVAHAACLDGAKDALRLFWPAPAAGVGE
jgi:hypothetical protein